MERNSSKPELPTYLATITAYQDFEKDSLNVLRYASPDVPQEVKDEIALHLKEIGTNAMDLGDELEHESILPEKRVEIARQILTKKLTDWMTQEGILHNSGMTDQEQLDFISSFEKH